MVATQSRIWMIGLAVATAGAAAVAACLVWLVLTQPVEAAEAVARLF